MFTLRGKQDGFRLILPDDFICDEINDKYTEILNKAHSFYTKPIDFLNESIQSIQVLGLENGTIQQQQPYRGYPTINQNRVNENNFMHTVGDYNYRSEVSPVVLIDKTLNVNFRHTLGFVNYFLVFENFFYQFARDRKYKEIPYNFNIDILNQNGELYSQIKLLEPVINGIDMLDLNYTQPYAQSQTFRVEFKYSNIDFQFIQPENTDEENLNQ